MHPYRGSSMVIIIWGGMQKKIRGVEQEQWFSQEVSTVVMHWYCWWRNEQDALGFQKEEQNKFLKNEID